MNTTIFLIILTTISPYGMIIKEMPNMQMCESVGKSIESMSNRRVKWTCIEGPRG